MPERHSISRRIITPDFKKLSIEEQCRILGLSRSTYYYRPKQVEPDFSLHLYHITSFLSGLSRIPAFIIFCIFGHLQSYECFFYPSKQGIYFAKIRGFKVTDYNLRAIYLMKSLSKGGWVKYRMPYLLRNLLIDRPNQVWCTDITYVAMEHGFMYLYAIIDVYSRYIVGWGLYNSLDASNAIEVLDASVRRHGAPEIINSDQGCQYTSKEWHETCDGYGIKISMDGKARCLDRDCRLMFSILPKQPTDPIRFCFRAIKFPFLYLIPVISAVFFVHSLRQRRSSPVKAHLYGLVFVSGGRQLCRKKVSLSTP